MTERQSFHHDGRIWVVHVRRSVRRDEADTHLTIELVNGPEMRVLSCRRDEWDTPAPDFAALLARSVAAGASRQVGPRPSAFSDDA